MDKLLICFLLTVSISQVFSAGAGDWSYVRGATYGPANWGGVNKKCDGSRQSPIDIIRADVVKTKTDILGQLELREYWNLARLTNPTFNLTNKGKTVQLDFTLNNQKITTKQGGRMWELAQFHLHWSNHKENGSEHTLDGMEYPAEIHFVHFNTRHGNIDTAIDKEDGLMVMGFFIQPSVAFQIEPSHLTYTAKQMTAFYTKCNSELKWLNQVVIGTDNLNTELGKVLNASQNIKYEGNKTTLQQPVDLNAIVSDALNGSYYNYRGSLTTPPCDESVTWNVFKKKLMVTQAEMDNLRLLMPTDNANAARYRPVQKVNDRVVRECCQSDGTGIWQYDILDTLGPIHWGMVDEKCDGQSQSPIDIAKSASLNQSLTKVELASSWDTSSLGSSTKFKLVNKGYTVQLTIDSNVEITSTQSGITWRLEQFHLHWSVNNGEGSEHTMDGKAFPGEIHFVHSNTKYVNISVAGGHKDGLMVMGFFLEIDNSKPNTALDPVFNEFENITHYGNYSYLKANQVDLKGMVSDANGHYYHYSGSLTTPPCNEVVTWNVMQKSIYVHTSQLEKLRMLQTKAGVNARNQKRYRPVQALNGRTVERCCYTPPVTSPPTTTVTTTPCSGCYLISSVISIAVPVMALLKLAL